MARVGPQRQRGKGGGGANTPFLDHAALVTSCCLTDLT